MENNENISADLDLRIQCLNLKIKNLEYQLKLLESMFKRHLNKEV